MIERLNAREIQTRRLGRRVPDQTLGDVLKCDCPDIVGFLSANNLLEALHLSDYDREAKGRR
jgi:hypothetical protein